MRVLDRYIVKAICGQAGLVLLVLLVLLAVFGFVNEQGWVGAGRYGNLQALGYVAANLPTAGLQLLPVGALIGSLLAMGALARGSEITVMRASGIPVARLCLSVLLAGLVLVPPALVIGEWVAPPLARMAQLAKVAARSSGLSVTRQGGVWLRDGDQILRADGRATGEGAGGITVFALSGTDSVEEVLTAAEVREAADGRWQLPQAYASRFGDESVAVERATDRELGGAADADFLRLVAGEPQDMSLRELSRAIAHLERNGQDARRHQFAFWSVLARMAAIPLAMLLAVPLLLGTLRTAEGGARMTLGLVLGLGYFIIQRMVESGTIAFNLNPVLLAWLPAALLALAVTVLLARTR